MPFKTKSYSVYLAIPFVFIIYTLTQSALFNIDGMGYANVIQKAERIPFSSGNHILYPAVGYSVSSLFSSDPLHTLIWFNIIAGTLCIALFIALSQHVLKLSIQETMSISLGLAFSYGYWFHSTDAEDMMLGVLWLLIAFILGYSSIMRKSSILIIVSGLCLGMATLFHANLILGLFILLSIVFLFHPKNARTILTLELIFTLGLFLIFSIVTIAYFGMSLESVDEFKQWLGITFTSQVSVWGELPNPVKVIYGFFKTFVSFPILYERLSTFLDEGALWQQAVWILSLSFIIVVFIIYIIKGIQFIRKDRPIERKTPLFLLLWIFLLGIPTALWAPGDVEFWIAILPPVWLLIGWILQNDQGKGLRYALWLMVGILLVSNFILSFYPASIPDNNEGRWRAERLQEMTTENDLIITPGANWISIYVAYFAERDVLDFEALMNKYGSLNQVGAVTKNKIQTCMQHHGEVWVGSLWTEEEIHSPAWEFLKPRGLTPDILRVFFEQYPNYKEVHIKSKTFRVYTASRK